LNAGFQVVPNVLLRAQSRLNLDAVDVVILLNLNLHWWAEDRLPYPPPTLIAKRMGVSRRTVERRILRLQKEGWLERLPAEGNKENRKIRKYDLTGLVERLKEAAIIGMSQRNYRSIENLRRDSQAAGRRTKLLLGSGKAIRNMKRLPAPKEKSWD
jgi:DNA-binding MarR family transcriptional regulator